MSSLISRSSCFSAIYTPLHPRNRSHLPILRSTALMMMNNDGRAIKASGLEFRPALNHTSKGHFDVLGKASSSTTEYVNGEEIDREEINEPVEDSVSEQQRSAKIHDFCFGIPYGGIVLIGGLVGYIFSRNTAVLMTGGLYGGAVLALSILSLKIWSQGQSSIPFILGQTGVAAALLWKNIQTYSLTKKILPTGFSIVLSAAMLCFYSYVMLSGGNPPPKKLKSVAASQS
ncbi:protein FATTY ACID EXPORT 1, chloroplastic-like isoform X2 [Rutidosis leptorrhynchoides]|uniref:protein FATTY ACID EXPORT 1, chloroplastic-like isoform X1 n=1 Tax=Rutidosis leptorrhynchoides TaxID=125765 RepID=UPI003A9A413B